MQKELAISPDEAINLGKLVREFRTDGSADRRACISQLGEQPCGRPCRWAIQKMSEADAVVAETFRPKLKAMLSVDQFARLQQIHWQALGASAISESDVAERRCRFAKVQQEQNRRDLVADFQNKQTELVANEQVAMSVSLCARNCLN